MNIFKHPRKKTLKAGLRPLGHTLLLLLILLLPKTSNTAVQGSAFI